MRMWIRLLLRRINFSFRGIKFPQKPFKTWQNTVKMKFKFEKCWNSKNSTSSVADPDTQFINILIYTNTKTWNICYSLPIQHIFTFAVVFLILKFIVFMYFSRREKNIHLKNCFLRNTRIHYALLLFIDAAFIHSFSLFLTKSI